MSYYNSYTNYLGAQRCCNNNSAGAQGAQGAQDYSSTNAIVSIQTTGGSFSGGVPIIVNNIYVPAVAAAITSVTVGDDVNGPIVLGSTLEVWIEM